MKRVYISVTNDLVTDQRVHRVANMLVYQGMDVTCIGRRWKWSPEVEVQQFKVRRFSMLINKGPLFYAFFTMRLFLYLIFAPRPSLFIANDLDTLPAVFLAAKIRGVILIYDSHEFFTQVPELIDRKLVQSVWKWIESRLLPRLDHAITVSYPIATIYRRIYGTRFKVVRNVPGRRSGIMEKDMPGERAMIIYQGALNVGRGLELMIHTMKQLEEVTFVIAGTGDIDQELKELVEAEGVSERVVFAGRLNPTELVHLTSSARLGISLEEDLGRNYRYALPNKIFDYIQCRIPVLCSSLPEMAKIVESYGIGVAIRKRDPENIAKVVRFMLEEHERGAWDQALELAAEELCWEKESDQYLAVLKESGIL
ncbi:MAG: glycosyltransferase family 4 protein [Bacteroidetes bacterium]|nr:glycosyltransferase family 4 protein [Bacteroidota bacterium]